MPTARHARHARHVPRARLTTTRARVRAALLIVAAAAVLPLAPLAAAAQAPASAVAPASGADPTIERARKAVEANQAATVKGELAAFVKANPKNAAGAFWLGRVYAAEGDWAKAD